MIPRIRFLYLTLVSLVGMAILLGASCSSAPQLATGATLTPSVPQPKTPLPAMPVTPSPLLPVGSPTSTETNAPCGYMWATQPLPELTDMVQQALLATGLKDINGRAEAYGENCMDAKTGKARSFATMETDFRISLSVADLTDQQALGQVVEQILAVIDRFPVGQVPGPQPGYIGINFTAAGDRLNLWFRRTESDAARQKGLKGTDLLAALMKQ
jgi:hypothetical protein